MEDLPSYKPGVNEGEITDSRVNCYNNLRSRLIQRPDPDGQIAEALSTAENSIRQLLSFFDMDMTAGIAQQALDVVDESLARLDELVKAGEKDAAPARLEAAAEQCSEDGELAKSIEAYYPANPEAVSQAYLETTMQIARHCIEDMQSDQRSGRPMDMPRLARTEELIVEMQDAVAEA